jgi:NADH-quinone oxidoreductase subunit F
MQNSALYLTRNFGRSEALSLKGYRDLGGFSAFDKALAMDPQALIDEVKKANLRGRGGAGFATGVKWGFLPKEDGGARYLVVNADEGEPGTFKDRPLMEQDPFQLLEGVMIASRAIRASAAYIYIRGEFKLSMARMQSAIDQAYEAGLLGQNALGRQDRFDVTLHPGAGAYICGEETALLESLEGKKGQPRLKPPFPALKGLFGRPTIINNVETLCCVPHIIALGSEAWGALGVEKNGGTKMFCVSGQVCKPGGYEFPHAVTLRELVEQHAGGALQGRTLKAVIPGGSSSPVLTAQELDVRMDFDSLMKAGSMLGSAAVIVMDDSTSMVRALHNLTAFYSHESCGQCTPCREGTHWLHRILTRIVEGNGKPEDLDRMLEICDQMVGKTICVLADACAFPVQSFIGKFRAEFEAYIKSGKKWSLTGWREETPRALPAAHAGH